MAIIENYFNRILLYLKSIDILLLLFISLFTIDKVVAKPLMILVGLVAIWKYISSKDIKSAPLFYVFIPIWGTINFLFINTDFSSPHFISFCIGVTYWLMSLFAFIIIRNRVVKNDIQITKSTIDAYFVINCLWSVGNLVHVMVISHSINPFMLTDERFGSSTGDYIRGLLMAPSFINMFICTFYCVYYLYENKYGYSILATVIACLTTSNFSNFIFVLTLITCMFVLKKKQARLTILFQLFLFSGFYILVAFSNMQYLIGSVKTMGSDDTTGPQITANENKQKENNSDINGENDPSLEKNDTLSADWMFSKYKYGKLLSLIQTIDYLKSSPIHGIFGAGIGEFSSQLAERTSDLPVVKKSRIFTLLPVYVAPAFRKNNYKIFYAIYKLPKGYHSIRHFPTSFVNQILGEYGIVGLILFLFFYLGYFLRDFKKLSYTLPCLFMLCYFLLFTYLFEYLSVIVFFELFFLLNKKQFTRNNTTNT